MLTFMILGMTGGSVLGQQLSSRGLPRSKYGELIVVLLGMLFFTAGLLVAFRDVYFSRSFIALSATFWLVPALIYRAPDNGRLRRAPITHAMRLSDPYREPEESISAGYPRIGTSAPAPGDQRSLLGVEVRRWAFYVVAGILLLSFLISALGSAVLSPRGAPDERHHYSYVKYVAEHPFEFPPRFENMRTDYGDPNHLVHPPLYYQLMAIPYAFLDVDRQLEAISETDEFGGLTSEAVIPPLRAASLVLVAVHLVGVFVLLAYLVRAGMLPAWGAIVAAACLGLVPAFTYVAGTLNNDVLALALWPYLALSVIRYVYEGDRTYAYVAVMVGAAAILTKATLWVLVVISAFAVVGAIATRAYRGGRARATRAIGDAFRRLWVVIRPESPGQRVLFLVSVISAGIAISYLLAMEMRYGSVQPGYTTVYGLPPEESKFRNIPEGGIVAKTPLEFAMWASALLFRSLFGVLGQHERIYPPDPEFLTQLLMALAVLGLVLAVIRAFRHRRDSDRRDWIMIGLMLPALVFLGVFLLRAYVSYHRVGHFGAQGRYLIGYIDLWVVGLIGLSWMAIRRAKSAWSTVLAIVAAAAIAFTLVWLFVDPLFYLSQTSEIGNRVAPEALSGSAHLVDRL
jgi:hypothetical protein